MLIHGSQNSSMGSKRVEEILYLYLRVRVQSLIWSSLSGAGRLLLKSQDTSKRYDKNQRGETALRRKMDAKEHLKMYGGLREGTGLKRYLHDPIEYTRPPPITDQVIDLTGFDDEDGDECDSAVGESGSDKKGKVLY